MDSMFSEQSKKAAHDFMEEVRNSPNGRRRWEVSIYRNVATTSGQLESVRERHYMNVRSTSPLGQQGGLLEPQHGILRFITPAGKEVVVSGVPFMVEEMEPAPESAPVAQGVGA